MVNKFLLLILFIILSAPLFAEESKDGEHINRGINYFSEGDYKRAVNAFAPAIALNHQSAEAYQWLGMSYLSCYDISRIIRKSSRVIQQGFDSRS
jgi:tetratricopeptide (TPR) repeat protein